MRAVPVTPRQVMFTVCGQCPSLHAEGLKAYQIQFRTRKQATPVTVKTLHQQGSERCKTCRITVVTSVTKPTLNQNLVNIYLRRVLQFGKQFPRNRDSKYTDKAERKINKQVTQPFSIHSTAAAELTAREGNQKAALSPYGAFHYGNYSKKQLQQQNPAKE